MKRSKTTLLIFILIAFIVAIVVTQISRDLPILPKRINPLPIMMKTDQEFPTAYPTGIKVTSTDIPDQPIEVTRSLRLKLNSEILEDAFFLQVEPQARFIYTIDKAKLEIVVEPDQAWGHGTAYKILLFRNPNNPLPLDRDYEFTFNTVEYTGI